MTIKEFRKLQPGTRVRWEDDPVEGTVVAAGELLYYGAPAIRAFVKWDDGQETVGSDEASVAHISVAPARPAPSGDGPMPATATA